MILGSKNHPAWLSAIRTTGDDRHPHGNRINHTDWSSKSVCQSQSHGRPMETQEQPRNLERRTGKHIYDVATSPGGSFFLTLCLSFYGRCNINNDTPPISTDVCWPTRRCTRINRGARVIVLDQTSLPRRASRQLHNIQPMEAKSGRVGLRQS